MTWADFQTESAVAAHLAGEIERNEPFLIDTGRGEGNDLAAWVLRDRNGVEQVHTVDLHDYAASPARATGHVLTLDHESFITYVARHKDPAATTLWGNPKLGTVKAVINDHSNEDYAGWGDHRASLQLQFTEDWNRWNGQDGRLMSQAQFAEHLEDGADSVVTPSAADMLEIAQTFTAKNNVNFRSAHRVDNGEVQLTYEESIQAKAGQKGSMTIPTSFELGLAPFEGGDTYRVLARFRYRLHDGHLSLGYKLVRPDLIVTSAFSDVTKVITERLELPVMHGDPRRQ